MILTRHSTSQGPQWSLDGQLLSPAFRLAEALQQPAAALPEFLTAQRTSQPARGDILAPVEPEHEVWASGVTYLRSRDARIAESATGDIYQKVYHAARPELFFKATGWRVTAPGQPIRVRRDSPWNVPEPELVLVLNVAGQIVGYTAGNDVSSRSIESENPLYLPQAKIFDGACALGPSIILASPQQIAQLSISLTIQRAGQTVFQGETSLQNMKRSLEELVEYLYRELTFPYGAFLFTGTGLVPPDDFTLQPADQVQIRAGELLLENSVEASL